MQPQIEMNRARNGPSKIEIAIPEPSRPDDFFIGKIQGNVYGNWKVTTYLCHALVWSLSKLVIQV